MERSWASISRSRGLAEEDALPAVPGPLLPVPLVLLKAPEGPAEDFSVIGHAYPSFSRRWMYLRIQAFPPALPGEGWTPDAAGGRERRSPASISSTV